LVFLHDTESSWDHLFSLEFIFNVNLSNNSHMHGISYHTHTYPSFWRQNLISAFAKTSNDWFISISSINIVLRLILWINKLDAIQRLELKHEIKQTWCLVSHLTAHRTYNPPINTVWTRTLHMREALSYRMCQGTQTTWIYIKYTKWSKHSISSNYTWNLIDRSATSFVSHLRVQRGIQSTSSNTSTPRHILISYSQLCHGLPSVYIYRFSHACYIPRQYHP
jgi:hypothetical protein